MSRSKAICALLLATHCSAPPGNKPPLSRGPRVLGAQPALSLQPDGGAPPLDAGFDRLAVWVTGRDSQGEPVAVDPATVSLDCTQGDCAVSTRRPYPGGMEGVLAIIVDGSCSNSAPPSVCTGCPTDPSGQRVAAVKALVRRLSSGAPRWRLALFDFGNDTPYTFLAARLLAGYTQYPEDIIAAADHLTPLGGTWVFDSIFDVAPTVAGERRFANVPDIPQRILLVSDGEDTSSRTTLRAAVRAAQDAGVPIDVVGYGKVHDGGLPLLAGKAYRDLRVLASETGGFATFSDSAELPALFEHIADAYRVGFVEVRAPAPGPSVDGTVQVGDQTVPFSVRW